ncbi:hypothetical protein VNO77_01278 [Canavalia gladiata]|uniref:RING-type domain-containing protein n=1 Tax=Canavalia gladiata TaxID=3824 RepID=A0AAN9MVR3_CANGL
MADNDQPVFTGKVGAVLIAMGTASFVVTMYHLIILCCNQPQPRRSIAELNASEQARSVVAASAPQRSIEESAAVAHLIPAHKYEKKKKSNDDVADGDEDGTCAVCLGEFEEGEDVRTLPECMHSFHVPCIDAWLYSHSSCPICRADATPSPAVLHRLPELGSGELNGHHSIDVMQIALVQSALARG